MAKKKTAKNDSDFSFESSFEELQEIVDKLEDGKMSLTDSLQHYEIGIKRLKQCHTALNQAELKIRQLVKLDDDGNLITSQFEIMDANDGVEPGRKSTKKNDNDDQNNDELF